MRSVCTGRCVLCDGAHSEKNASGVRESYEDLVHEHVVVLDEFIARLYDETMAKSQASLAPSRGTWSGYGSGGRGLRVMQKLWRRSWWWRPTGDSKGIGRRLQHQSWGGILLQVTARRWFRHQGQRRDTRQSPRRCWAIAQSQRSVAGRSLFPAGVHTSGGGPDGKPGRWGAVNSQNREGRRVFCFAQLLDDRAAWNKKTGVGKPRRRTKRNATSTVRVQCHRLRRGHLVFLGTARARSTHAPLEM